MTAPKPRCSASQVGMPHLLSMLEHLVENWWTLYAVYQPNRTLPLPPLGTDSTPDTSWSWVSKYKWCNKKFNTTAGQSGHLLKEWVVIANKFGNDWIHFINSVANKPSREVSVTTRKWIILERVTKTPVQKKHHYRYHHTVAADGTATTGTYCGSHHDHNIIYRYTSVALNQQNPAKCPTNPVAMCCLWQQSTPHTGKWTSLRLFSSVVNYMFIIT